MKKLVKVKVKNLMSAICEKGHLQTSTLERIEDFDGHLCTQCNSKVLTHCTCGSTIKGGLLAVNSNPDFTHVRAPRYIESEEVPKYCHDCGKAYPWVENFLAKYKNIL